MCATDGSSNGETALWVALIVLGGVVCIAIIVTVAIMLKRTATYRKEAEHYERQQKYATSLTRVVYCTMKHNRMQRLHKQH